MKVLVNRCFGGFGLSADVGKEMGISVPADEEIYGSDHAIAENLGLSTYENLFRCNPLIIAAVEKIGLEKASANYAKLNIVEIPDDVDWYIDDYDGMETIREIHRSW